MLVVAFPLIVFSLFVMNLDPSDIDLVRLACQED